MYTMFATQGATDQSSAVWYSDKELAWAIPFIRESRPAWNARFLL